MKIKLALILLFILGVNFLQAQGKKTYNDLVNKSENAIIVKNYKSALSYYSELKKQNYIFSRDIYNAIVCANKIKDWQELNYWAEQFIAKGAKLSFFKQSKYDEFRTTRFWKLLTLAKIKNLRNEQLIKSLDSLTALDQNQFVKLKENPETKVYNLTEEIDKKLFLLEKKYGKITEENAGINIEQDTIYFLRPKYAVLYRHSYQSHKENSFFKEKEKNKELERVLYYNNLDYNLLPITDYQNRLYFLKENMLPIEIKDDFVNFQKITRIAYKNKDFTDFSFYYPIFKFANFVDKESENNFEIMLKELYTQ